jgi:hypothetical protein
MALPQQLTIAECRLHKEQVRARVVEKEVLRRRRVKQETSQFKHAERLRARDEAEREARILETCARALATERSRRLEAEEGLLIDDCAQWRTSMNTRRKNEGEDKNRRKELRAQLKQREAERLQPFIDAWVRAHDGRTENTTLNRGW